MDCIAEATSQVLLEQEVNSRDHPLYLQGLDRCLAHGERFLSKLLLEE